MAVVFVPSWEPVQRERARLKDAIAELELALDADPPDADRIAHAMLECSLRTRALDLVVMVTLKLAQAERVA